MFEVPPTYVDQIVKETWAGIAAGAHLVRSAGFSVLVRFEMLVVAVGLVL